jgi:sensor histidine kinase YesM
MSATASSSSSACAPGVFTHPLEMIPVFRRWPRSMGRDLLYTLIWNTLLTGVFTGFALLFDSRTSLWEILRVNLVFAQSIGLTIHVLFMVGDRLLPGIHKSRLPLRTVYYTILPVIGVFIGYSIASYLLGYGDFRRWLFTPRGFAVVLFLSLIVSAILLMIFLQRERAARAETAMALEQARVAAAERATTTARLKLLEAQIEPHFLYNTLAHVISLIDHEPSTARHMVERLIELLRATAAAPANEGTLADQLRWLRAYLEILQLRMGGRLQWRIDVPEDLLGLPVPPMILQPVVENAIKHGLEPKIEGGRLEISARRGPDGVRLTVRDSGLGFRATRKDDADSLGLANLRARLLAAHGADARLIIEDNAPSGACVSVVLPSGT